MVWRSANIVTLVKGRFLANEYKMAKRLREMVTGRLSRTYIPKHCSHMCTDLYPIVLICPSSLIQRTGVKSRESRLEISIERDGGSGGHEMARR